MCGQVREYQRENVMMFTRIMDKLQNNSSSQDDVVSLSHAGINMEHFPCSDINELQRLNTLCKDDPVALKILV